ncbi:unnamed protein product [Oppiella nova]|uniref:Mediator of RNA polymerase II transcription subunit 25 n=1 Tax=Oppiella nova TaxID=334625 RepID=A0A7R9LQJ7_9ACAR|nr:unnamed protein product [Oppiella nova]CAG2165639.1 unnamed protein product [Oppiella nova]
MVVSNGDQPVADVVFLVEATANLSPYVESLKTNYIIPTLEYFSGGPPDERDYGFDNNYNCTLYALVSFMTVDCAPEPASQCFAPTTSSHRLLQWLDKIQFIGGAGESCSHITEGFSTALQVFDDFTALRENTASNIMAKTTKHCILICNSPPYSVQTLESQTYSGLKIERLATLMSERNINFSVFSPRKMSFLYKLYEEAGGDLTHALNKNFAKDKRHLVLLRGFSLQERPLSPQLGSQSTATAEQKTSQNSPMSQMQGIKRSLSPGLQSVTMSNTMSSNVTSTSNPTSQMHATNPQLMTRLPHPPVPNTDIPSPFPPNKTPTPDTIVKQGRGSPVPISTWASQPNAPTVSVSSSSSPTPVMSVLKGHLNMRTPIRTSAPQMPGQGQGPGPGLQHQTAPTLVSLVSQPPQPIKQNIVNTPAIRPGQQIRGQQPVSLPFSAPQAPSPQQSQPSPLSMQRAVPSPQSVHSPMQSQPQQSFQQPVTTMSQMISSQPQFVNTGAGIPSPQMKPEQRRRIWAGTIEYQEKPVQPGPVNPANRITYSLNCQISCHVVNGEPEINAEKWPEKLILSLLPKQLIMRLFPMLKNGSYHISLHFNGDPEQGLSKLSKIMSTNWVGCIQFTALSIRMMIILYMPDKRMYMGFVPHDQEEFFKAMREIIETHKKEQQAKQQQQKMMVNPGGQMPVGLGSQQVTIAGAQTQIGGQMPVQLSVQSTQPPQLSQPISAPNSIFQLQQMSGGTMQQTTGANISSIPLNSLSSGIGSAPMNVGGQQPQQNVNQNVLLNQALGPPNNSQKNAFIASNLQTLVQNTGPQMPPTPQQPPNPTGAQSNQQFGLMQNPIQTPTGGQQLPNNTTPATEPIGQCVGQPGIA